MENDQLPPSDGNITPEVDESTNFNTLESSFTYSPLDHPLQIRLQALSYVWGPPFPKTTITVDGHQFQVGEGLAKALRRLRKPNGSGERVIWIDALSINQNDTEEKGHQVGMMKEIYEGCEEVIMWLGEEEDDTVKNNMRFRSIEDQGPRPWDGFLKGDFEFDRLKEFENEIKEDEMLAAYTIVYILASNKHIQQWPFLVQAPDNGTWEVTETYKTGIKGIEKLVNAPYWSRVWIIQETILPPRAIVVYGRYSAPWNMFADTVETYLTHGAAGPQTCCREEISKIDALASDLIIQKLYFVVSPITLFRQYRREGPSGKQSLLSLLHHFSLAKATDQRDKVYALLSLLNPGFEWPGSEVNRPKPDYASSALQAYKNAAMYIITSTQSLAILSYRHLYNANTPSWAANWGTPADTRIWKNRWEWEYPLGRNFCFSAAKGSLCGAVNLRSSQLMLWGLSFDTITAVGALRVSGQGDTAGLTCEELLELAGLETDVEQQPYAGGGTWESASWRTICHDCNMNESSNWRRTNAEDVEKFESWHKVGKSQSWAVLGDAAQEFYATTASTINVRPFVTKRGYLGMGPAEMKVGHEVWVVKGSNVPLVLERSGEPDVSVGIDGEDRDVSLLRFVGCCYVHGIMDGEYFEEKSAEVGPLVLC